MRLLLGGLGIAFILPAVMGCARAPTGTAPALPPGERTSPMPPHAPEAPERAMPNVTVPAGPRTVTVIVNSAPYGSEAAYNALRLADALASLNAKVRIFLMADGVYVAKRGQRGAGGHYNAEDMLLKVISRGVPVRVSDACTRERGITQGEVVGGALTAKVTELAQWVAEGDEVISF
jgi:uncharacterized protein involved in oxidation of intracellular sulfur